MAIYYYDGEQNSPPNYVGTRVAVMIGKTLRQKWCALRQASLTHTAFSNFSGNTRNKIFETTYFRCNCQINNFQFLQDHYKALILYFRKYKQWILHNIKTKNFVFLIAKYMNYFRS